MFSKIVCFTFLLSVSAAVSVAAPHPATSTSRFLRSEEGYFASRLGFSVTTTGTSWTFAADELGDQNLIYAPKSGTARLSLKMEALATEMPLKKYINKVMSDYVRYGMQVRKSSPFKSQQEVGYLVDLSHPKVEKQIRQYVFLRKKSLMLWTCDPDVSRLVEDLKTCNAIIENLQWN